MFPTNQLGTSVKNDTFMYTKNSNETSYKQYITCCINNGMNTCLQ